MKLKNFACIASILAASLCGAKAASTLSAWTFDNNSIGINSSPAPSTALTGSGTASALGMGNTYNNTNSVSSPDVQGLTGSSSGNTNSWRIRGFSTTPGNRGNGWSTNAPIGTQGAQFTGSTFGYHQILVAFDVYATADAEANLQVQYTMNGSNWVNATISSVGSGGTIQNNTSSANTVLGSYVQLVSGWNNQITADLTGLSAVDNNANFAIRLVNASTGPDCLDMTGAVYNNTSGNWTFDNVAIQGASIDFIADWIFDSVPVFAGPTNTFPAIIGSGFATQLGMSNNYTYNGGEGPGSIAFCDVLASPGASTGAGANGWRIRGPSNSSGGGPGQANGWNTQAPIGTQGAEFDADTSGYTNIICTFDIDSTGAAEGKLCVLYTTDNWVTTTNVAQSLYYQPVVSFNHTNSSSPNTVAGNYVFFLSGGIWYNNFVVDFSGVPGVANNPNFGIRIVNAATGADCLNAVGTPYNNSSGNWRYDNVVIGGTAGNPAPAITPDPNASVDGPFTNTFTDNAAWRSGIYGVTVNGAALTNTAYTISAGQIVFTTSNSPLLKKSGLLNIVINATGFGTARYSQSLAAGVATHLAVTTQAIGPTASGGTLVANPSLLVSDQYGNGTTNPYANVSITASVGGSGGWTLGGDTLQTNIGGVIAFTNLTATLNGSAAISNAVITFTISGYPGYTTTNSSALNIGVAPVNFTPGNLAVLQLDANANNTTFSIIELKPSATGQTASLNIVPISATGTNALRESNSGSCGKLSLSDDGTLTCFAAFLDGSAATPDETFNLNRTGSGVDYSGHLTNALYYVSNQGASQARSAVSFAGNYWLADDKGGLYEGNSGGSVITSPNANPYNNVVVRVFGGVPWVETQKSVSGLTLPVVYSLGQSIDDGSWSITKGNNLGSDGAASDFYMVSTNGGTSYDILYILDGASTNAPINKYSYVSGNWVANGSFTNSTGGDSLFVTTNGSGGIYLYLTTGVSKNNSLVRMTDAGGWNGPIHIVSSNVLYTAKGGTYLKGITFVPQQTANAGQLIPPPILTAQSYVETNGFSSFTITNTPDDPLWRSNITAITVNGSPLSSAAYTTNSAGKIVFNPSQDPLLQSPGVKNIVISAAGYSANSITQVIVGGPAQLAITTQPKAPAADGGVLATQPVVVVQDQNGFTVLTATPNIVAQVGAGAWTIGGTTTKAGVSGMATFSGLTAFGTNAVIGATISFTSDGLTGATSSSFNISAPIQSNLGAVTLSGGKLKFSFANATGLSFSVLGTNNIAAPLASWPVIGTAVENPAGSGNYQFTDPSPATNSTVFYILRQP